jgi:hypothetical protein
MTRCAWIVFGLLAAGCYRSQPPVVSNQTVAQRAPSRFKRVTHRYCEMHEVPVVCDHPPPGDDMCPEEGEDTLELRELRTGKLAVEIELVRTNGHTCTFEGELTYMGSSEPGIERWSSSESTDEVECTLELLKRADAIEISSTGCREYCGARASLDARFDTTASCPAGSSLFDEAE